MNSADTDSPELVGQVTSASAWVGVVRVLWLIPSAVLVLALGVTWSAIVPLRDALPLVGASLACAAPGVLVARRLFDGSPSPWLSALLIGPAWGYGLTSLMLLALWTFGFRDARALFGAIALASVVSTVLVRPLRGIVRTVSLDRRDVMAVCCVLLLVPAIVGRPYARVGEQTPEGEAWRAYFTADFVWAVAVVAEVSKGDVPPHNPFRVGEALHYYWLAHLLPSVEHRLIGRQMEIRQILLVNAVLSGLAFLGFLYFFTRHFVMAPAAAALGCLFAVCFHSFEGLDHLVDLWYADAPLTLVKYINIDAVTRWIYHGIPIDGLQRLLLYQPQHQLGYVIGLSALLLFARAVDRLRLRVIVGVATLLTVSMLLSTFSALMVTTMAAVLGGSEVIRRREWVRGLKAACVGAVPLAAGVALGNALHYVEHGGSLVSLHVNRLTLVEWPTVILLSFGATLGMGCLGLAAVVRSRAAARFALVGIIMVTCWFFYFFVDVRDHQNVYVSWRAGHLLFIASAPLIAYAFEYFWRAGRRARVTLMATASLLALAAAPTTAIDLYNSQDITNFGKAPGFRWTLMLHNDEVEALDWIRRATPRRAIVQVEPFVRDSATWAYIPAFAERRMAAGLPISMIPHAPYEEASKRIRTMYQASSARDAHAVARRFGITHLVIGPEEASAYPHLAELLDTSPLLWRLVYHNHSVRIYEPSLF